MANLTFTGTAGQRVSAQVPNTGTLCESAPYQGVSVSLYKPDGTAAVSGSGCRALSIDQYLLPVSGTYTFRVDPLKDLTGVGAALVSIG